MSSGRAGWVLICVLETCVGAVACGGTTEPAGAGGASPTAGAAGSKSEGNAAGAAAGGSAGEAAGAGGLAMGGTATAGAPSGGASAGQASVAGSAGVSGGGCSTLSQTRSARTAKSAGFAGDYVNDYYPLYTHPCQSNADCAAACVTAGGTQASCVACECVDDSPSDRCLPPTYWIYLDQVLAEGNSQDTSTQIIMVNNPYRDTLVLGNFQFELPNDAKIAGVSFSIKRSAGSENMIADYSVRALQDGAPVGLDRGQTMAWPSTFQWALYGGVSDLWGATWTAEQVNATGFGVALTPLYLDTAGNERGYVDFVTATVSYEVCL